MSVLQTFKTPRRRRPAWLWLLPCAVLIGGLVWMFGRTRPQAQPVAPVITSTSAATPPSVPEPVTNTAKPASPQTITDAPPPAVQMPHSSHSTMELQIALVRAGMSPGSIDGVAGGQTRSAIMAFQRKQGLTESGSLDEPTKAALTLSEPPTIEYAVTSNDLARLMPMPTTWLEKSQQQRLDYETLPELLGEKAFCSPTLVRRLNPSIDWPAAKDGNVVTLPNTAFPALTAPAAFIKISLADCVLEAFDASSNLLVHFPCSIGHLAEKRPSGELHVATVAVNPNYTFNPAVFPESAEAKSIGHKLIIPPGPNNPVGVAWIGLDKPGYGIHGTPGPEQVGRTESHGCFRLANWNAEYLVKLVSVGMPVIVQ